jgi:enoyl-CoA hydratase
MYAAAMEASSPVLTEQDGRVLVITMNRPEVRNAFNLAQADALSAAIDQLESSDDLAVGVLTGAGKCFSAGMDLKAFATGEVPFVEKRGIFGLAQGLPTKPLIAAVEGMALAGGFEVMMCCDLVIAAQDAQLGIPEVRRGLLAAAGGLMNLPKRIPYVAAMELALTGEPIDGGRAAELGLVNRAVPPGEALSEAMAMGKVIAQNAPLALAASKEIIGKTSDWTSENAWQRQGEIAGPVLVSEDAQEGARAFAEKRDPVWRGR